MKYKKMKYKMITFSDSVKKKVYANEDFNDIYASSSFFIRFYAYLPLIHSLRQGSFTKSTTVLDLGCADGPFLPTLNYFSERNIGVEINLQHLSIAKNLCQNSPIKLRKTTLLNSDAMNLPFKDKSFDLIFCLEVLEHVNDTYIAIKEMYRVLKKSGILICSLPIEIGFSLLIRTILGKLLHFRRPSYSLRELINSIILKKPEMRLQGMDHKNFDWRTVHFQIRSIFQVSSVKFTPLNALKNFNPIVIIKAVK
ncbi:MAG: methyltransferase domain-containing protein [Candidatus Lokiarchaeota archaeon]|nr:methyltransferase domain-containing protein [Candidatus Lokiarchaeota archaeon]